MMRPQFLSGGERLGASMLTTWLVEGENEESHSLAPPTVVRPPRSACGAVMCICGGVRRESAFTAPSHFAKSAPAADDVTTSIASGLGGFALPGSHVPILAHAPFRKSHA